LSFREDFWRVVIVKKGGGVPLKRKRNPSLGEGTLANNANQKRKERGMKKIYRNYFGKWRTAERHLS